MTERQVEIMDGSDSDSAHSDTTVIPNPRKRSKSPRQKKPMVDAFVDMAEKVIAESETLLSENPGSYGEDVEIQHSTLKEVIYAAEWFLYGSPHAEGDTITSVAKKLWHINSRYNYRARQAEKKNAQAPPQPVIPQPVPVPRILTPAIAPRFPITLEQRLHPSNSPIPHTSPIPRISPRFPTSQPSIAQRVIQEAQRRDREAKQQQLQSYRERMQLMKEKEEAMRQDLRAFQRDQQELATRMQQLEVKLDPTVTASPPDVMGEYDDTSSYSNTHVPQNSTPVTQADKIMHDRVNERSFRPIVHTGDRASPIPQQATLHIPRTTNMPQIPHITHTKNRQLTSNSSDSANKRQRKAETTTPPPPMNGLMKKVQTQNYLPYTTQNFHYPHLMVRPYNSKPSLRTSECSYIGTHNLLSLTK